MLTPARTASLIVVAMALIAYAVAQPSLTPPAGPIEESGRFGTLIELNQTNTPSNGEALFVISSPGSYVLASDADAGTLDGILIESDDVTVDLNGYTLRGQDVPGLSGVGTIGIAPTRPTAQGGVFNNITIRNGSISGFPIGFLSRNTDGTIPNAGVSNFESVRLERLNVNAENFGILLARITGAGVAGGVIDTCMVRANDVGIDADTAVITNCRVYMGAGSEFGGATGIDAQNSTVTGCTVVLAAGLDDFNNAYRLFDSSVTASASSGGGVGFTLNGDSIANSCVANNSAGDAVLSFGAQVFNSNF